MNPTAEAINRLLPQTQCRECGYLGCAPYAEALAAAEAAVNLCAPGGEEVMHDLAALLDRVPLAPAKTTAHALAWIDEAVCIGCTACIRACPTDAIMGASKLMHSVIQSECTGCGLCVAPCPVDCIHMQPVQADYLPQARFLSDHPQARFAAAGHALERFQWQQTRKTRDAAERKAYLAEREAAAKARLCPQPEHNSARADTPFNPADLIAKAMARAQAQQAQRIVPANREAYQAQQIEEAKARATYRRAQRDLKYGNDAEKTAALEWLRAYKAEQEAKQQQP
ncbi:RnfABCDGE type electron transport complex subunit B [Uruburuella testudinis]|uniref:RnfABCDGE type electron transport complex subunit B n=1 Tax=Uruburuella testudinis TaxID=1282863 RepID=A0ABY4DSS6_9NEIS|nr:RnfABCDGE type electron transport complex subunit B [Uruburuella testudinis]UOO81637.1 RnfABCDGE type electron transport complex subunit B [Uruburuella testudinis]